MISRESYFLTLCIRHIHLYLYWQVMVMVLAATNWTLAALTIPKCSWEALIFPDWKNCFKFVLILIIFQNVPELAQETALQAPPFRRLTGNDICGHYFCRYFLFFFFFFLFPPSSMLLIQGVIGSKNLFWKGWSECPYYSREVISVFLYFSGLN